MDDPQLPQFQPWACMDAFLPLHVNSGFSLPRAALHPCLFQDHGHPQAFWVAADISKAEDKTVNREKVVSSCSTLRCQGTEQQRAQHTQPLQHAGAAHKISPKPIFSSVQ